MNEEKKKRTRRSAEKMAELVLESERVGASQVCRRVGIAPAQLSRWRQKFLQAGIGGLKEIKRGPKEKENPIIAELKAKTERLSQALLETSIEIQVMKKRIARFRGATEWSPFDQGATRGPDSIY